MMANVWQLKHDLNSSLSSLLEAVASRKALEALVVELSPNRNPMATN